MNFCSNCGHQLKAEDNFCNKCGKSLRENNEPEVTTYTPSTSGKETIHQLVSAAKNTLANKKWINKKVLISAGVLLSVLIVFIVMSSAGSPSKVAEEFVMHSKNGEYDKAEALWSESGKEYIVAELGDERWIQQSIMNIAHRTDGTLYEYEVLEEDIYEDNANVVIDLSFDNGRREKAEFGMVKEEGKWKVFAFR